MTWARLDDGFYSHPKLLAVGNAGKGLFASLLTWSCRHLTNGDVTGDIAVMLAAGDGVALLDRLVEHRLLVRVGTGYRIHDFDKYQLDGAKERAERARKAANQKASRERRRLERGQRGGDVTGDKRGDVTGDVPVTSAVPDSDSVLSLASLESAAAGTTHAHEDPAPLSAEAGELLGALRAHPSLATVATPRLAAALEGARLGAGKPVAWLVAAIAEAAGKAAADDAVDEPQAKSRLARFVAGCCRNARDPASAARGHAAGSRPPRGQLPVQPSHGETSAEAIARAADRRARLEAAKARMVADGTAPAGHARSAAE